MDFDINAFRTALTHRFNMDDDDAEAISTIVAEQFWGEDEVNDEDLDKETRSVFYTLQTEGILSFRRTEYKFEGATRRAFFWRLTDDALMGTLAEDIVENTEQDEIAALYANLQNDAWNREAVTA